MSTQKPEKIEKPEELIRVERLIEEGKLDEAEQLLSKFKEKGGHALHDIVQFQLLNCELLFWRDLYEDVVKLAEQTHKVSLGLGKNILSVDILLIMAYALLKLYQTNKCHNIIKQAEEELKALLQELPAEYKQRKAFISFLKGWVYEQLNDGAQALKHFELSISLREELGAKPEISHTLIGISHVLLFRKGDFDNALKYAERGKIIAEESGNKYAIGFSLYYMATIHLNKGDLDHSFKLFEWSLTIFNEGNNKLMVGRTLSSLGVSYLIRGELNRSINFYEQSLEVLKGINSKILIAGVFNGLSYIYKMKGELDHALDCIEQSMAINREVGSLRALANNNDSLIGILIDKGDLTRAQLAFHELEQLTTQLNDKQMDLMYLINKALLLTTSLRARDRGKAEEILMQLLKNENLIYEDRYTVLLILCELFLTELRITNDPELLEELTQFTDQLFELAEKSHSYWILGETYLIQAKLSLLSFDIKQAQRFLTQTRQLTERFDLSQLRMKVDNENEDLDKKLYLWEKLKEEDASMSDRMELARLDEKIVGLVYNRAMLIPHITEEKVTISKETKICLVCKGEVFGFSYICKCGATYCENCARALSNLENVCWACEVPIDYSKPVKPYKEEAERIKVQEQAKKKK